MQPLNQGGDLVTWVRQYIRNNSLSSEIFDTRLNAEDKGTVDHMIIVLKIALLCTSPSPHDRPSMREVVLMLMESNQRETSSVFSRTCDSSSVVSDSVSECSLLYGGNVS